jgi:hypothetical protein
MLKRNEEHRNPIALLPFPPNSAATRVIPLRSQDTDSEAPAITRWVNLGDKVLGNARNKP